MTTSPAMFDSPDNARPAFEDQWRFDWRVALLLAVPTVVLLPGLLLGPEPDASVFLTMGDGLTRGQTPYVDLWDHKPPGIYVIHAIGVLLPGDPWIGVWTLTLMALLGTALLLLPLAGVPMTVLAMAISAAYPATQGGGMTETFSTFLALASIALLLRSRPLLAGIAAGCAALTSLQLLAVIPALVVLRPRGVMPLVVGIALPIAAVAGWLGIAGAWAAAWDSVIRYSAIYLGLDQGEDLRRHLGTIVFMVAPLGLLAVLGHADRSRLRQCALVWLVCGLAIIAMNGRLFPHYFTPLLVPLAVLARSGAQRVPRSWVFAGLLIGYLCVSGLELARAIPWHAGPSTRRVAEWLSENSRPSDEVLVWGFQPAAAVLADRPTAGRYAYFLPLTTPSYSTPSQVAAWVDDLRQNPPAVIVDGRPPDFKVPAPGAAGGRDLDIVQPFRAFVAERYRPAGLVAGRQVYVLIREAS